MRSTLPAPDVPALSDLDAASEPRRGAARRAAAAIVSPAAVLALLVVIWYAVSYLLIDPQVRFLAPPPHEVVRIAFLDPANLAELLAALWLSARVAMSGLAVAVAVGLAWAIAMSQARWLERSLYPYAVVLQTIPVLALVPVFGYWFGYTFTSRLLVCVLIALFPIVANTLFGLRSVDAGLHDLFALHGSGRWTRLIKLQLPAALPAIFTGLRISAGASVIGAIVGDFFFQQGQPGIGQLIYVYPKRLQSEQLVGAVILACLFGLAVFWFFGALARRVTAWHDSQRR